MGLAMSEVRVRWGQCVTQRQALSARLALGEAHAAKSACNTALNAKH